MISITGRGKWLCILAAGLLSQGAFATDFSFAGSQSDSASMHFTSGGIGVTVTPSAGNITQNSQGLGVRHNATDPYPDMTKALFGSAESLTFQFDQAVNVGGIAFGDWGGLSAILYPDKATVSYNGTSTTFDSGRLSNLFTCGDGSQCYPLGGGPVTQLTVTADGGFFRVKDLCNVTPVPLPGAVWLFGSGLLGLGLIRRRRQV